MTTQGHDFRSIRQWAGSQHRAFEELCYQLRDPTPENAELVKTGDPDAGLEWYVTLRNRVQWGWQAKYTFDIDTLLRGMERSLRTVVRERPRCHRLTFCIPFDLPDAPGTGERKSARQKFEDRKEGWRERIPGAERVRIQLWSEGDLLERLVRHPNYRGMEKFFWDREVFSPDWCVARMEKTLQEAGGRYSPKLHIDLPVAFALEGLAQSQAYWQEFRARRGAVLKAAHFEARSFTGLGVTRQLQLLARSLSKWRRVVPSSVKRPDRMNMTQLLEATRTVWDAAHGGYPDEDSPISKKGKAKGQAATSERRQRLRHYLRRLVATLEDFEDLLESPATKAAGDGALLLAGDAGQGKTHLFCDAAQRAVSAGHPAVVLLGGQLSGRRIWSEIADRLGLGPVGSEVLIGAMQSAGEASNAPFLLLIDALNEAQTPKAWQDELPVLLAGVAGNPWISIGLSVRSTYRPIVLPAEGLVCIGEVEHRGFAGREVEATERFFNAFDIDQPGVPLLEPEFRNPLFLKLYCEGLRELGMKASPTGEAHVSAVFDRYLESKAHRISSRLEIDPGSRPVHRAIDAFCGALTDANRDSLPSARAEQIIREFAAGRDRWPDTLLGQLLSEGVLTREATWQPDIDDFAEAVRFTYQRFADYRIGSALLTPLDGDPEQLDEALEEGAPLRSKILEAPPGWIEALSVQVPEKFGVELLDAAQWKLDSGRRSQWDEAFVRSIATRQPSAVRDRSREILKEVQQRSSGLRGLVLKTMLLVAPSPGHPLNADFLHSWLSSLPMPDRDAGWSIQTYFSLETPGALSRLIRWAAQGPYPHCSDEVVELAALPIVWTFGSPNRRMRDYATKALVRLLSGHLSVLAGLIRRFDGVDDPYLIERLAVVAYAVVLCAGVKRKAEIIVIAGELKAVALSEAQVPNVITRDAVRGIHEWCIEHGLMSREACREVLPPYGAEPPRDPRTIEELTEEYRETDFHDVLYSICHLGDFGKYIVAPRVGKFSRCTLDADPRQDGRGKAYPVEVAQSWIFERVVQLGWTPERFGDFDRHEVARRAGRSAHKPERFGKKYQWIAFRELMARIADNHCMSVGFDRQLVAYSGPWQFRGRDIDPTLPPPRVAYSEHEGSTLSSTFSADDDTWWRPLGPRYRRDEPLPEDGWVEDRGDIPESESLMRRLDTNGKRWIVLHAEHFWHDDCGEDGELIGSARRQLWCRIDSWLGRLGDQDAVLAHLAEHSLVGSGDHEGREFVSDGSLGELPWGPAFRQYPDSWCLVEPSDTSGIARTEINPTWVDYLWEGSVLDCSIDDAVHAACPAPILFGDGGLTWVGGSREWQSVDGSPVVRFAEEDDHSALLAREDWLERTLRKGGYFLAIGLRGEKQFIGQHQFEGHDWSEFDAVASLSENRWTVGDLRVKRHPGRG